MAVTAKRPRRQAIRHRASTSAALNTITSTARQIQGSGISTAMAIAPPYTSSHHKLSQREPPSSQRTESTDALDKRTQRGIGRLGLAVEADKQLGVRQVEQA